MIRHQSAMIVTIYIEIGASFFIMEVRIEKLSLSSKLRTDSLCVVQFCLQKTQRICKMKSKDDNIHKKYCDKKRGMVRRDCLQSSLIKHLPLTTVKCLQWKIDDTVESTDNLPVEENEKLLLNKNTG